MPPQKQPAEMPKDTWPITRDDKAVIQDLGRKLAIFLEKEFEGQDTLHTKIVVGAFNYIMDLQTQKTKLIGDDFLMAGKFIRSAKMEEQIEEPFTPEPELPEPTVEERRAHLETELAALDVEEASVAPSASATPAVDAPVEAPAKDLTAPPVEAPAAPVEGAVPSPVVVTEKPDTPEAPAAA